MNEKELANELPESALEGIAGGKLPDDHIFELEETLKEFKSQDIGYETAFNLCMFYLNPKTQEDWDEAKAIIDSYYGM